MNLSKKLMLLSVPTILFIIISCFYIPKTRENIYLEKNIK